MSTSSSKQVGINGKPWRCGPEHLLFSLSLTALVLVGLCWQAQGNWGALGQMWLWLGWIVGLGLLGLAVASHILVKVIIRFRPEVAHGLYLLWRGAFLSFLVVLLSLVSLEWIERKYRNSVNQEHRIVKGNAFGPFGLTVFDQDLGWKGRSNTKYRCPLGGREFDFVLNSEGFRDREREKGPTEKPRVLIIGDSLAWGWGVKREESFTTHLRREIRGAQIINQAVNGYGIDQVHQAYKKFGHALKADVVVWVTIFEMLAKESYSVSSGCCKPWFMLCDGRLSLKGMPLPEPSKDLKVLHEHFNLQESQRVYSFDSAWKYLLNDFLLNKTRERYHLALGYRAWLSWRQYNWNVRGYLSPPRVSQLLVKQLHNQITAASGRLLVFLAPPHTYVHHPDVLKAMAPGLVSYRQAGPEVIDLTPALVTKERVHYLDCPNSHPDAMGHSRIAKAMAPVIRKNLLGRKNKTFTEGEDDSGVRRPSGQ